MKRFKSAGHAQRFLSAFSRISPHFRPRRHRLSATGWRTEIDERFAVWREVSVDDPTVWVVTRSDPDPIVVNLPELDKFAGSAARKYPHP